LLQQPFAGRLHALDDNLVVAARLIQRDIGAHQYLLSVLRTKVTRRLLLRNIAQRTWALSSLRVKYQWPEDGWLKLEISPLIQTWPISCSSSRRTV
jgi:hypothetical protein